MDQKRNKIFRVLHHKIIYKYQHSGKVIINVKAIYTNDYSIQVTVTSTNTTQTIQNTIASVAITGIFGRSNITSSYYR